MRDRIERPSRIVAFDLATTTGWAQYLDGHVTSGWHANRRTKHDSAGMVFLNWRGWLTKFHDRAGGWDCIYYETSTFSKSTYAAHVYGALWGILTGFAEEIQVPYQGIEATAIKKHATGAGNANKEKVLTNVRERYAPNVKQYDEADAIALLYYALDTLDVSDVPLLTASQEVIE